jgi:hypothetical protein
MAGPDPWISRGSLVATTIIALACIGVFLWEDLEGRTPSQFLLIVGTAAVTQLGNIIAALYPAQGRRDSGRRHEAVSPNGQPETGQIATKEQK